MSEHSPAFDAARAHTEQMEELAKERLDEILVSVRERLGQGLPVERVRHQIGGRLIDSGYATPVTLMVLLNEALIRLARA